MGEHREQFVDVTTTPEFVDARAHQVREWLRRAGWAAEDPSAEDWLCRSRGQRRGLDVVTDVVGHGARGLFPGLEGTWTVTTDDMWVAGDGTSTPECAQCGRAMADDVGWSSINEWFETGEPVGSCQSCGWTAALGDWDLSGSIAVGNPGVVFDVRADSSVDYEALLRQVRAELVDNLGGRWTYVHHHL